MGDYGEQFKTCRYCDSKSIGYEKDGWDGDFGVCQPCAHVGATVYLWSGYNYVKKTREERMEAVCVLINSKSFMIESVGGQCLVPRVKEITTGNGSPKPGHEEELEELLGLMLECEQEDRDEQKHQAFMQRVL